MGSVLRAGTVIAAAAAALAISSGAAAAGSAASGAASFAGQGVQLSLGLARQLTGTEASVALLPSTSTSGGAGLMPIVIGLLATVAGFLLMRRSQTN